MSATPTSTPASAVASEADVNPKTSDSTTSPVKRRLSRRFQVNLVGEGALVGLLGGGVVTFYRLALSAAEKALRSITGAVASHVALVLGWVLVLVVILLVVSRLMTWEPTTAGSGIPQVDAEVMGRMDMPWHRVILAKFCEGTLLTFAGLSMGREGPSVQLGGMSGKAVSRLLHRKRGEERLLVTCGAAAGMSAAFHAPLTGVLFAIEEIHKEFTAPLIISVMTSSVVADFLVSQVLGIRPVMSLAFASNLPHADYLIVIVLGLACGVAGALHNTGMFACKRLYRNLARFGTAGKLVVPFALAGVCAFVFPDLMCGGDAIVEKLMAPHSLTVAAMLALLIGKYVMTTVAFGSNAPGGTLFPMVVMGGLIGAIFGAGATAVTGVSEAYLPNFIALGIAGLFAGAVRAPVTAVVLVFELTGSLDALLSVTIVSILAYVVANLLRVDPYYEHLLADLLGVTPDDPTLTGEPGEKVLKTVYVSAGSRMEGKSVGKVPWPDGTRIVTIDRAGQEIVPTGETRLMALDSLLLIMDAEYEDDVMLKVSLMCESTLGDARGTE